MIMLLGNTLRGDWQTIRLKTLVLHALILVAGHQYGRYIGRAKID